MWFKNSDKRKSMEVRVYEADGFLERERLYTLSETLVIKRMTIGLVGMK